jgi:hypothetical protein
MSVMIGRPPSDDDLDLLQAGIRSETALAARGQSALDIRTRPNNTLPPFTFRSDLMTSARTGLRSERGEGLPGDIVGVRPLISPFVHKGYPPDERFHN